jgi:phage protein U
MFILIPQLSSLFIFPWRFWKVSTVYIRIKLQSDLQADKSSVVVKGPFFPQVWTQGIESVEQMCDARNQSNKVENFDLQRGILCIQSIDIMKTNLIYENRR